MSESRSDHHVKLSFCISTRNRATLIGATIEGILSQATADCEIVVVDGASTDDTESVMSNYAERDERIRYFKQEVNGGVDRDFDRAVTLARGEYCWLLPDDDFLTPNAVHDVLGALCGSYSVVLVNAEMRDSRTWNVLISSILKSHSDRQFGPEDLDDLFVYTKELVTYIGCTVVNRELWLTRHRKLYYDCDFIHVGVIFQAPLPQGCYVISRPLASIRFGNQQWFPREFEIWMRRWPAVINSLPLSSLSKDAALAHLKTLRKFLSSLLNFRASGVYSRDNYREFTSYPNTITHRTFALLIALIPGVFANTFLLLVSFLQDTNTARFQRASLRRSPMCCSLWNIKDDLRRPRYLVRDPG